MILPSFYLLTIKPKIKITAKDLIKGLLTTNPQKRLTAEQALQHPWVAGGDASTADILGVVAAGLLKLNAKGKFKAAVKTIQATIHMKNLLGGEHSEAATSEEPAASS